MISRITRLIWILRLVFNTNDYSLTTSINWPTGKQGNWITKLIGQLENWCIGEFKKHISIIKIKRGVFKMAEIIFSGMRPTGKLHLGNYLGALENWVKLQEEYKCFFGVVDLHALTTGYDKTEDLNENTKEMLIDWFSAGIDPERSTILIQSYVPEHAELHLLFSMITPLPWLERNPVLKEQVRDLGLKDNISYGLLGYPVLMASDILIYKANAVPVGEDQVHHIELAREIARRFNNLYKNVFPLPQLMGRE